MTDPGQPVPLTIVGGFLGAGKTTLVNRLLAEAGSRRFAVLVNDFGKINIDAKLIGYQSDAVVSLANGCICCEFGDNVYQTVFRMLEVEPPLDGIVIEASGVADPAKLAILGRVGKFLRLNATVILVDAANVLAQRADRHLADTIARQIAAADLVAINKCDIARAAELAAIEEWVDGIAPGAARLRTVDAEVPIDVVLGAASRVEQTTRWERLGHRHDHDHVQRDTLHRAVFSSWAFTAQRPFIGAKLRDAVAALPPIIVRGKGVLWLAEGVDRSMIFHLVGRRFDIVQGPYWEGDPPCNNLVFIAANAYVDFTPIDQLLTRALVD
jgi:G3E family GTPase